MTHETAEDLDRVIDELYRPNEYLDPSLCVAGHYYWGHGRSISEIAICTGPDADGKIEFEGWREKFGEDFLFREIHYDNDSLFGTFVPFVDLGEAPSMDTTQDRLQWILEQMIGLAQDRLEWVRHMPKDLQQLPYHQDLLRMEEDNLTSLLDVKQKGLSNERTLTFKDLMSATNKK